MAPGTNDAEVRLRSQEALNAVRVEFTAPIVGDPGVGDGWVVPFGGFITATNQSLCSSRAVALSAAIASYEDGTFASCEWTTPTTTPTSSLTSTSTTTATTTTSTTATTTATSTGTTTLFERGSFRCATFAAGTASEENFFSVKDEAE